MDVFFRKGMLCVLLASFLMLSCGGGSNSNTKKDADSGTQSDQTGDMQEGEDIPSGEDGAVLKDLPDTQGKDVPAQDVGEDIQPPKDVPPKDIPSGEDVSEDKEQPPEDTATGDVDVYIPQSCNFEYDKFVYPPPPFPSFWGSDESGNTDEVAPDLLGSGEINHWDPPPLALTTTTITVRKYPDFLPVLADIVMPTWGEDGMPLFNRANEWTAGTTRCYETPLGVKLLTEAEAYDLYRSIAEKTTAQSFVTTPNVRTVVGIRGAYPGTFAWHGNKPDRFNDTLVLLWIDEYQKKHVLEFPANTDTGASYFDAASSLRPNRVYPYKNGWHKTYNALAISISDYAVRDDANHNGHWDSDRNGWLPPLTPQDFDRTGGAHNIHMGSVGDNLWTAAVDGWSAGCQVIPGMINWTQFITHAWTGEGDPVKYFLVDARDIDPTVWHPCTPDGTHECPYHIASFPYDDYKNTSTVDTSAYNVYNCSPADESGPEVVYVLNVNTSGILTATIVDDVPDDLIDMDIHLLEGDDPNACIMRNNYAVSRNISPGRWVLIVDTFVENGKALVGPYHLKVTFE